MKQYFYIRDFLVFFYLLFLFSLSLVNPVYASTWVTSATFNNDFYIQVQPNQNISTDINVNTWADNSDSNDNDDWSSTQYTISGQNPICINTSNHDSVGFHNEKFNILSPSIGGTYNVTFTAFSGENCVSGAINTSLTLINAIIVVDSTPPETNILDKPRFATQNTNADFTFSSDENSSFECKLDNEIFSSCNSPKNYSNLSSGSHTFSVRAIDMASNVDPSPATYTWVIDNISPIISINSQITNNKLPKLTGSVNDNTASISVKVNNESYPATNNSNGTWEVNITNTLPDGTYDVIVTATDLVGNVGTDSTSNELTIDSIAPTATFKHYLNGVEFTGAIARVNNLNKLKFTGIYTDSNPSSQLLQDSYVIFQAQNDGSFNFSQNSKKSYCTWRSEPNLVHLSGNNYSLTTPEPFTKCISDLPEGEYYMSHQVYDNAVRKDIPSITQFRDVLGLHFIIDKTAPTITLGTYSTAPTNQDITITATTNEGTLNTTSHTFTQNASFDFIATDTAGNITTKTITISNIDKQKPRKPEIVEFKNPNLACGLFTNQKYITVDWSDSSDNVAIAGYDYLIDYPKTDGISRGTWQVYFTQSQYRGSLNEGIHNIKVRAKDTAGNVSDWSDICSITYDSIKPVLKSKTSFSGWYNSDQISSFQYTDINLLDNYTDSTCTISTEGSNQTCTVNPNVCDKAGNCNTTLVISNSANIDKTISTPTPTPTNQPTNYPTNTPTPTPTSSPTSTENNNSPTSSPLIAPTTTNFPQVLGSNITPTIITQNQISENQISNNQTNNQSKVLGETTTKTGRWLPILSIIAFVLNFFYLKYSSKFLNFIPFIISSIFFLLDWLLLKKYGCGISWLNHYFWIGGILSWLIPIGIKNKIYQK
jgi:hypothetical protein